MVIESGKNRSLNPIYIRAKVHLLMNHNNAVEFIFSLTAFVLSIVVSSEEPLDFVVLKKIRKASALFS